MNEYRDWETFRAWAESLTQEQRDAWVSGELSPPRVSLDGSPEPANLDNWGIVWDHEFIGGLSCEAAPFGVPIWEARDGTPDWDMDPDQRARFDRITGDA